VTITQGSWAGYWSAVSQIVPVLALALVLEARVLSRRWARRKALPSRVERRIVGIAYVVTVSFMVWVELTAIYELAFPAKDITDAISGVKIWTTYFAIAVSSPCP
jgi:hypothetical protein